MLEPPYGLGLLPDPYDARDFAYRSNLRAAELPARVDLRARLGPVRSQDQTSACVGFTLAALLEFCGAQAAQRSPLYVYYEARRREGRENRDEGTSFRAALKALADTGACREALHPFGVDRVCARPSIDAYADGRKLRVATYERVGGLPGVRAALASGQPVALGVKVCASFYQPTAGRVPVPGAREAYYGGHAILAVGYDDAAGELFFRNSWGPQWGAHGYGRLPYGFFAAEAVSDMWTATVTTATLRG